MFRVSHFEKRTERAVFFEQIAMQKTESNGNTVGFIQNGRYATRR